jgi:hypothetical protein
LWSDSTCSNAYARKHSIAYRHAFAGKHSADCCFYTVDPPVG